MRLQSAAPRTARDDCKTAIRLVARQNARLRRLNKKVHV